MTIDEVRLAMRCLGLRPNRWSRMTRNGHTIRRHADRPILEDLIGKQHALRTVGNGWRMTQSGIQQLKLQIGEF